MELGKAIREVRREKGVSQKDLAVACGVSANAMVSIEKGRSFPTKKTILAICQALNVSNAYLLLYSLEETDIPVEKRPLWQVFTLLKNSLKEDESEDQ